MSSPYADDPDPWGQGLYARPRDPTRAARAGPPVPGPPPPASARPERRDDVEGPRHFRSVEEFVNAYLAAIVARRLGQGTSLWCPEWWRHTEAVVRFTALWRAFESLALEPEEGISTWWIHHADPHLRALMDPDFGPFALCDPYDGHASRPLDVLPVRGAPRGVWANPLFRVALAPDGGETTS
ncbi:DUF4913 domain-containing protein [Streptodolium elevatio]|uniref:DUF4913 domain-containing protein n=1 Tax=Streptodolium elevatio TaxID=3157996 RepID=A0ABV3D9Q8_9ACTN